jgi:hypothetical protein
LTVLTLLRRLTRTIKVSCSSRFLLLLLHSRQIYNALAPDTQLRSATLGKARICPHAKFCIVTQKWLRLGLYRDTAPVPSSEILYRDSKVVAPWFVPRSRQHSIKLCHDCKNTCHTLLRTPKPWRRSALHRDYFLTEVSGPAGAASGNTTSLYCRAVIGYLSPNDKFYNHESIQTENFYHLADDYY